MGLSPGAGVGEKVAADIAIRTMGYGVERVRRWYGSYDLLILGMERAGKTSFFNFLRRKLLATDGEPTPPTLDDVNTGVFSFEWTTDQGILGLELRNVGDRSGQVGPNEHAKMFVTRKPHLLVVVLDVTRDDRTSDTLHGSYERWFEWFCSYVAERLMNRPRLARRVHSRLRQMIVLLNKSDALPPHDRDNAIRRAQDSVRAELRTRLRAHLGPKVDQFPILPCSIVRNPQNGRSPEETASLLQEAVRQMVLSTGVG